MISIFFSGRAHRPATRPNIAAVQQLSKRILIAMQLLGTWTATAYVVAAGADADS